LSVIGAVRSLSFAVQNLATASPVSASRGARNSGPPYDPVAAETDGPPGNDLAALLEALYAGDAAAATSVLVKLSGSQRVEAGTEAAASEDGEAAPDGSAEEQPPREDDPEIRELAVKMEAALDEGGTEQALRELTAYLVGSGRESGNLLNLAA
jgi:hypothetical protein